MKWLAPSAQSRDPARMHGDSAGLVNSPSISHARAPNGCPLGASCTSFPDCTIKPRQLPEEPRWLLAMSVQCQVADILVRASFKESGEGYKKTGREDVELECMMMGFNEYRRFDHKVLPFVGGGVIDGRVMKLGRTGLRSLWDLPVPRSSGGGRERWGSSSWDLQTPFLLTSLPTQIECVHEQLIPPAFALLSQCLNSTRPGRGRERGEREGGGGGL